MRGLSGLGRRDLHPYDVPMDTPVGVNESNGTHGGSWIVWTRIKANCQHARSQSSFSIAYCYMFYSQGRSAVNIKQGISVEQSAKSAGLF